MAIRGVGKHERIRIEVEGVRLLISRITSAERQRVEDRLSKRGQAPARSVMDALMPHHIHGYEPSDDPNTWIYDEDGEKVEAANFDAKICMTWAEDIKAEIYDAMHTNSAGQDIRQLAARGEDRLGNSGIGSAQPINLTD